MKTTIATISLSAVLACLTLSAQEPPRPAGSGLAERFKQLDRNGDGKLTREETAQMPLFDQWDKNKDGAVTMEELQAFYTKRRAGGGADRALRPQRRRPGRNRFLPRPRGARQDFMPDAPFVGEVNGSYIDPEFSEAASQVVFQDVQNRVWIGDLDPATGLFKTATGRDYLMDENITIIFDRPPQGRKFSTNGPESTETRRDIVSSTPRRTRPASCSSGWRGS